MTSHTSADLLGLQQALVGRYSIVRELGRGGMGVVYLAQEVLLDRPVALKVLPPEAAASPDLRERFMREARLAARLSHPNIVPIHAVHDIGGYVFFAMSYIEGETLGERIRTRGPLSAKETTRILREVGWALAYAHAQGVVHRDVKPDNILIESATGRAVVTDFGIAHSVTSDGSADALALSGTPEFMSPEQAAGGTAAHTSDLYALGVVGYYMLSGRLPFHGDSSAATLAQHLTQAPVPLGTIVPALPLSLAHAVDRCLAKEPDKRFATGEELADMLSRSLEERREVPHALRHFIKQNRDATTGIVATEVFVVGSITVWSLLYAFGPDFGGLPALLIPMSVWVALGITPVVMLNQMARKLLQSGYDRLDLLRAMNEDLDEQRNEILSAQGEKSVRMDRLLKRATLGGLGVHLSALGWLAFGPWFPGSGGVVAGVMAASMATWATAGLASAVRQQQHGKLPGRGWLKFWDSRIGRGLFNMASFRLTKPAAGSPYGPTELAIGMAADRLFDALPTAQRNAFRELPDVVRRLESDAETMRARMRELDALIDEVADSPGAAEHEDLLAELNATRAAAEERLVQVVAALETIRVELLRLHAGAASVESVTMDLGVAKNLSSDVARMLEGKREVEKFLGRPTAPELRTMPTPA